MKHVYVFIGWLAMSAPVSPMIGNVYFVTYGNWLWSLFGY